MFPVSPEKARALGETGRKAVLEKFSVEAMAQATLGAFASLKLQT